MSVESTDSSAVDTSCATRAGWEVLVGGVVGKVDVQFASSEGDGTAVALDTGKEGTIASGVDVGGAVDHDDEVVTAMRAMSSGRPCGALMTTHASDAYSNIGNRVADALSTPLAPLPPLDSAIKRRSEGIPTALDDNRIR